MKYIIDAFIFLYKIIDEFIYPPRCEICGKYGKDSKDYLCDNCLKRLRVNPQIIKYDDMYFDEHLYIFKYERRIRKLLIGYKFYERPYLKNFFIKIILKNKKICRKIKNYDIMIPVPIHRIRKRKRGYDQSQLIAEKIVKHFDEMTYLTDVLVKRKNTIQQSSLGLEQRKQNVKQVYKVYNVEKIKNKKVILFDDIYTTGSTANECSRLLKENGVKEILVFTLAKD